MWDDQILFDVHQLLHSCRPARSHTQRICLSESILLQVREITVTCAPCFHIRHLSVLIEMGLNERTSASGPLGGSVAALSIK